MVLKPAIHTAKMGSDIIEVVVFDGVIFGDFHPKSDSKTMKTPFEI